MATKRIRVVHIITSLEVGGPQSVLYEILQGLDRAKFDHHIIYFRDGPYVQKIKELGIKASLVGGGIVVYDPVFIYRLYN